jgi:hypothetical protein
MPGLRYSVAATETCIEGFYDDFQPHDLRYTGSKKKKLKAFPHLVF